LTIRAVGAIIGRVAVSTCATSGEARRLRSPDQKSSEGELMNLRKLFVVLFASAIAFVALTAIGAGSAAASTTEECHKEEVNLLVTSQHFLDENCTKKSGAEGIYHTAPVNEHAEITMKETKVPIVLEAEPAGAKLEVSCGSMMAKQTVSNITSEELMGFKGTISGGITLASCTVSKPTGCTIKPIETVPLTVTSEDLAGEVQRTLFAPKEGTKFATLTISGCAIAGSYTVEGKLRSQTIDIHSEEFGSKTGSELTIGKSPVIVLTTYCWVTEADNKPVVRELP
jgi:hypothetical protein